MAKQAGQIDCKMAHRLAQEALAMRKMAYAPYSGFRVGAALLGKSGRIYTGCNVENAAFTPTCCAERTALFKAVSEGERSFAAIAVAGGDGYCPPCGVCRQALREFCDDYFTVILAAEQKEPLSVTLGALFPKSFGPDFLAEEKEAKSERSPKNRKRTTGTAEQVAGTPGKTTEEGVKNERI